MRVFNDAPDDDITQIYMNMMLKPVDYDPVAEALKVVNGLRAA